MQEGRKEGGHSPIAESPIRKHIPISKRIDDGNHVPHNKSRADRLALVLERVLSDGVIDETRRGVLVSEESKLLLVLQTRTKEHTRHRSVPLLRSHMRVR